MPTFSWEEIQKHNLRTDKWLVIDRKVYNITKWSSRHPGGHRVIGHYAGEDATVRVWGSSRYLSLLKAGVRSQGSQGAKPPPLNGAWGAQEGNKVCLLRSSPAANLCPIRQLGQPAVGVGFGTPGGRATMDIRAVENRAGSTARCGTHASASSAGFTRARDAPKGALGP